ncbi:MAG: 2-oxo acid dehydrogenase subunit E2 [Caldilineaceae bacterium]|nr:2-oxo acid dehydrogenase subunit E2 [Caldilineaceae bacterium]
MTQSWQSAPHVTFTSSIDMTQAEALRARLRDEVEASGARFTPTILIAKAVTVALTRHPRLNAWLHEDGRDLVLTEHGHVNLGMAVALEDGLIVPVVKDAQTLGLAGLAQAVAALSQRARAGELAPADVMDGTFTISNLGMYPIDHFTAIINPPQVAILAVGRTQVQPVWDGAAFQPTPVMQVTLAADHRAVDGAVAAAFLGEIKRLLEEPARMLV